MRNAKIIPQTETLIVCIFESQAGVWSRVGLRHEYVWTGKLDGKV